ncbi:hypothetical protein [Desulfomonile tiedjei]|uniref:Uncharacterized protein n=1 Tax=Desulfomonile tiedjei (strain ATCC 49306 / DSM 6799 / DCB-1) TaxID=706587 RepID=I4C8Y9_DESTA|nr:hypothetical protein [Desulfomonile tiedjei]AFM26030.1 hypothetical protein Desti_3375 [Desulfomonile tiedjei DSM 6799]
MNEVNAKQITVQPVQPPFPWSMPLSDLQASIWEEYAHPFFKNPGDQPVEPSSVLSLLEEWQERTVPLIKSARDIAHSMDDTADEKNWQIYHVLQATLRVFQDLEVIRGIACSVLDHDGADKVEL